jgi:hypothetical protein
MRQLSHMVPSEVAVMARGKTMVKAPALDNVLIRAVVAELPAPAKDGFPAFQRKSWIAMVLHAFDVVYGASAPRADYDALGRVFSEKAADHAIGPVTAEFKPQEPTFPADVEKARKRFYIDHDGFAMVDGQPLAFYDLPSIVTLYDERSGIEAGDAGAILWKDVGTVKTGLPAGVRLVPAAEKQDAA